MQVKHRDPKRIAFLDYLRVFACILVMLVHSCELYYFAEDGGLCFGSAGDAFWVSAIDSLCRASVPLFVMTSSYLLFPLTTGTGAFFKRRLCRVVVPFVLWCCLYVWWNDGRFTDMLFNFPMTTGGHLWFVPMLLGVYLLMALLSPWAEKVSEKELRLWLVAWFFTTTFPFLRKLCGIVCGAPSFGAVPYLYGECPWNEFGTFQYVSGFFGYLLLGFYCRKFLPAMSLKKTLAAAIPLFVIGYAITFGLFYGRIPSALPFHGTYADAVDIEMSWMFCSSGVALIVVAIFLLFRQFTAQGWLYEKVISPLSRASYGTYLMHMLILASLGAALKPHLPAPCAIPAIALTTFFLASAISLLLRKLPKIGPYLA